MGGEAQLGRWTATQTRFLLTVFDTATLRVQLRAIRPALPPRLKGFDRGSKMHHSKPSTTSKSRPCSSHSDDDEVLGVPQTPLEFLFKSVLPPASETVCSTVEQRLVDTGHIVKGHWVDTGGPATPSSPLHSLQSVIRAILDASEIGTTRKMATNFVVVSCSPSSKPGNPSRSCKSRPPAEFQLLSGVQHDTHHYLSTVIPCRGCGDSEDLKDLVWDCHAILRKDCRRRFTFGISVDGDEMRIWFFSRTHSFVSEPLDFIAEPKPLVRFVVAIAFATPEQLGYDESASCFLDDAGAVQYKLTVDQTVYITTKVLSDHRSDTIHGRSTRVWAAYREGDPERVPVVIKDLWMPADAAEEGVQLMELRDKLATLEDPATPLQPGDYFLTVLAHGFVQTTDGLDDHTLDVVMRGCMPPLKSAQHTPRKHYRIVFEEVGVPIDKLSTISEVMHALADATRALSLLHRLGLVHRDVSAGNILLVNGVGKLSDLEYMKSFQESSPPDPDDCLVGTREFTAAEPALGNYWFVPPDFSQGVDAPLPLPPPFRFNPLHDLESTMWIGIWAVLFYRRQDRILAQFYTKYFAEFGDPISRYIGLTSRFPRLPPSDPLYGAIDALRGVRARLRYHYSQFETNLTPHDDPNHPPHIDVQDIHAQLIGKYEDAATQLEGSPCLRPPEESPLAVEKPAELTESPSTSEDSCPSRKRKSGETPSACSSKDLDGSSRSTGSRKKHSPGVRPTRRSSRILAKDKKPRPRK
ncbi:hypothetical protein C8R46DRAFT_300333 [Mycena filopes]|nr:hypothetical protein C8R46DRAFT_300333 [Mycena filopes]